MDRQFTTAVTRWYLSLRADGWIGWLSLALLFVLSAAAAAGVVVAAASVAMSWLWRQFRLLVRRPFPLETRPRHSCTGNA